MFFQTCFRIPYPAPSRIKLFRLFKSFTVLKVSTKSKYHFQAFQFQRKMLLYAKVTHLKATSKETRAKGQEPKAMYTYIRRFILSYLQPFDDGFLNNRWKRSSKFAQNSSIYNSFKYKIPSTAWLALNYRVPQSVAHVARIVLC